MTEDRDNPSKTTSWIAMLIRAVLVYLGPLILITFDELVFRTFFGSRHSPEWLQRAIDAMYFPISWLFRLLTGR